MDQFWLGLGAVIGLALVCWVIWATVKIKKLASANILVMERLKDEKITDRIKAVSDAELDALLSEELGSGHPKN